MQSALVVEAELQPVLLVAAQVRSALVLRALSMSALLSTRQEPARVVELLRRLAASPSGYP